MTHMFRKRSFLEWSEVHVYSDENDNVIAEERKERGIERSCVEIRWHLRESHEGDPTLG